MQSKIKYRIILILTVLTVLLACLGFAACEKEQLLPDKLNTPQNLRVEGDALVWDEVEYADGYSVFLENTESLTVQNKFDLSSLSDTQEYNIKLRAYSDKNIASSDDAEYLYAGKFSRYTKGLVFEYDGSKCGVSKLAVDENGVCVIPAIYYGYKVEYFKTVEPSSSAESKGAFQGTNRVQEVCSQIKTLYLPYHLASTGAYDFRNLTNLENVVLGEPLIDSDDPERWAVEGNCIIDKTNNSVTLGCIGSVIPDYVTKIGTHAFCGRNIESFTVPEQITEIGGSAFWNCKKLQTLHLPPNYTAESFSIVSGCSSLKQIEVPQGVKNLTQAFQDCTSLTEVNIPDSVTNLEMAFVGCTSLKRCVLPGGVKKLAGTFCRCTALESVNIDGIEEIETIISPFGIFRSFYHCTSLKEIILGSSLKTIDYETFLGCTSLRSVSLPQGLTSIGDLAFGNCTSLQSVELPQGLTSIGVSAFAGCTSLQSIAIPDSVTNLGIGSSGLGFVFRNCTALKEVKLPAGLKEIEGNMFMGCTSLRSIVIPDSVTVISSSAFKDCTALESVVLPKQILLSNYQQPFENCPIQAVYYRGSEEEWQSNAVNISAKNEEVLSAPRYYYSEATPALNSVGTAYAGDYWRYVNGVPTKWNNN